MPRFGYYLSAAALACAMSAAALACAMSPALAADPAPFAANPNATLIYFDAAANATFDPV